METSPLAAVPFVWWRPDTYGRAREICAERDTPETFKEWRKAAQKTFDSLRAQGLPVVKVLVDPEELLTWAGGRAIDAQLRAQFAVVTHERENRQRH